MSMWKRGRAVECTGLENRQGRESFVSSNLTASAIRLHNFVVIEPLAFFEACEFEKGNMELFDTC